MNYRCFLLERLNVRTVHHGPCTEHDNCWRADGWDEEFFDVRRADTGQVIKTQVTWMGEGGLEPGAMYWADGTASYLPKGPDDWSDLPEEWERLKREVVEHPDWHRVRNRNCYPTDVLPTGLPVRPQSHLFTSGPQLHVMTPGGSWTITSRASNCGLPYDYAHRCWVMHGEAPDITVDKAGLTCAAGAGSIQAGDYHGFLRGGQLVP